MGTFLWGTRLTLRERADEGDPLLDALIDAFVLADGIEWACPAQACLVQLLHREAETEEDEEVSFQGVNRHHVRARRCLADASLRERQETAPRARVS